MKHLLLDRTTFHKPVTSTACREVLTSGVDLRVPVSAATRLLAEALRLPEAQRARVAATLLDSLEPPPGLAIEDHEQIERRATQARQGLPGVPWQKVKRGLLK